MRAGVNQKLDRPSVGISSRFGGLDGHGPHAPAHLLIDDGRGRFFNHLLVAALHGAFALAQVDHVAVLIAQHLDLNVARVRNELLHINFAIIERTQGFALRGLKTGLQFRWAAHQPHALAAAAGRGFDHHGIADLGRHFAGFSQ